MVAIVDCILELKASGWEIIPLQECDPDFAMSTAYVIPRASGPNA